MLSRRARDQIPPSAFNAMWEVMQDPWDADDNPGGYVNVGVAENHLMKAELEDYLCHGVDMRGSVLTYQDGPMGSHRMRSALARFLNQQLKPFHPLDASQIIVTNGVSNALEHASWAFANPGDAFILGRPYYGAVNLSLRPQVLTLPVTFGDVDPLGIEAIAYYEETILAARQQSTTVKGLLLCSPHNPLGQCYAPEVLEAFLRLCNKHRIHLVCDEIYALSVWSDPPFTSVLALDLAKFIDPSLVHVLWGVSKDFGANGWRVGCIISLANRAFHAAMSSVAIYSYVSSITDHIVAQMIEDSDFVNAYLAENRRRLASMYAFATDYLRRRAIPFAPGVHAAFFLWLDLGQAYRNRHLDKASKQDVTEEVKQALLAHKVYLAWGGNFDSESPGMFRIVFAHPRAYLEEALNRIDQALDRGIEGVAWEKSLL
ncbi:putative aspartate aminotransferase [Trichoderma chlorosporum]